MEICAKILLLAAEDPEADIYLYINSPGGSITAGMAIYDTMQFVPNDIVTVGIGMAASMGQFLLTAGTRGKRYITQTPACFCTSHTVDLVERLVIFRPRRSSSYR